MNIEQCIAQELNGAALNQSTDMMLSDDRTPVDKLRRYQIKKILREAGVDHDTTASKNDLLIVLDAARNGRAFSPVEKQPDIKRGKLLSLLTSLAKDDKIKAREYNKMTVPEMQAVYDEFLGG